MQSHFAQMRPAGNPRSGASPRVPGDCAASSIRYLRVPLYQSEQLRKTRERTAKEKQTWAANSVLLSPRPAPRPSSRFARHSHDSRRGIRPDVLHRVLQLVLVRDREMGRYPPKKVDRRHRLGKCRMVQTRVNIGSMRRVSLFLIVLLTPYVRG